jgi:rubrerythrin
MLTHLPAAAPTTVEEVLAVAYAMEREAAVRYADLGRSMRLVRHDDVAQVFETLATEEQHHVEQVERLAQKLLHHLPDPGAVRWELPATLTAEGEGGAAQLTPYRALSIAVQNEERAFAFWSYVAAASDNPDVRREAEAMARQELLHAAKLRHERRRAYHAAPPVRTAKDEQSSPHTVTGAREEAFPLEMEAAAFLEAAAERLDSLRDRESAALLRAIATEMRAAWSTTGTLAPRSCGTDAIARAVQAFASGGSAPLLFEAAGVVERLALTYLEWLGARADPALAQALEPLEHAATGHLARIHARLAAVEPALRHLATVAAAAP